MSKRSNKHNTSESPEIYFEKGTIVEDMKKYNKNVNASYDYQDIIPRLNYPIVSLKNLIRHNAYLSSAIDILVEGVVGKGFNIDPVDQNGNQLTVTDPYIIDIIKGKENRKLQTEKTSYGECWIEVSVFENKIYGYWFIPAMTMNIGKNKYADMYVQYYGIKGKEKAYPKFDYDAYKLGKLPNGVYIIHLKDGNEDYGVPKWISSDVKAMISKEQDRTVLAHFVNDTRPRETHVHYGISGSKDQIKNYKKQVKDKQGSEERGFTKHIFNPNDFAGTSGKGKKFEVIKHEDDVISSTNLELEKNNNYAMVASLGVPHFMVGLTPPNQLGNNNQSKTLSNFFIDNKILPAQREWYEFWELLFPDMPVMLNTMPKEQIENTNDNVVMNKAESEEMQLARLLIKLDKAEKNINKMEMYNENY